MFDQTAIASAVGGNTLESVTLELTISDNGNNWGASGRTLDIHRVTQNWTEAGATWNCAADSDTSNRRADCEGADAWEMGKPEKPEFRPFESDPTNSMLITNGLSGVVSFDVTSDVAAFLAGEKTNYGWIIKKTDERKKGRIEFTSRETGSPQLLIRTVSVSPTLTLANDGLIFRDQFDRLDDNTVANGWNEIESAAHFLRLASGKVQGAADETMYFARADQGSLPNDIIMQGNLRDVSTNDAGGMFIVTDIITGSPPLTLQNAYSWDMNRFFKAQRLREIQGGILQQQVSVDFDPGTGFFGNRIVVERSGTSDLVRGYRTGTLTGQTDLTKDFTLIASLTVTSPISRSSPTSGMAGQIFSAAEYDELIVSGRGVLVTGMPAGWMVALDSRGPVIESGGEVVIDMDTFSQPFSQLELLDGSSVLQDVFLGTFYGGAVFTVSQ